MQQAKKPFRTRFQLLLRLTLNAGKHPGNQPARLAQLDDGNDCAILVQGDEGPAQVVQLGHRGTPAVICQRRWCHLLRRLPHTISPLEGDGFELPVPRRWNNDSRRLRSTFWQADRGVRRPTNGRESRLSSASCTLPRSLRELIAGIGSAPGDRGAAVDQ